MINRNSNLSKLSEKLLYLVYLEFVAVRPNQLWVADFTYVATWHGFVHVAFVTDVFSRFIVRWRVLKSIQTDLVLDALDQTLWARGKPKGIVHHSDSSQYLSINYAERGSMLQWAVLGSYDNAMGESINALYKAEVIHKDVYWRGMDDVEKATLSRVDWSNHQRRLEPIGGIPPTEYKLMYYKQTEAQAV